MKKMKKNYVYPHCQIIKTTTDTPFLAGSNGNGTGKNDPHHGEDDNLAKPQYPWYDEESGTQTWNNN